MTTPGGPAAPRRGAAGLFDALFPPACVGCGSAVDDGTAPVCRLCWHRLPPVAPPRCRRCGATRLLDLPSPGRCLACTSWPGALPRAAAPWRMEDGASRLVHALKYEGARALAGPMGRSLADPARALSDGASPVLVPVPLSPSRLRQRGFNQAELLARGLSEATGWPVRDVLRRRAGGARQARLGSEARRRNVRGRFRAADGLPRGPALLVDDVLTTGATAGACARALARREVPVLGAVTFARALQQVDTG